MSFTPFKIYFLMCGFCSRFHAFEPVQTQSEVLLGSDASLRCDVSRLSESSTLQWEKDGGQTSNTTLTYDNSAYIILHNVDEHSGGKYYCKLTEDGKVQNVMILTLSVTPYTYDKTNKMLQNPTIYRQSSNNSDVSLICKSSRTYKTWRWTWEPRPNSQIDLMAVEKGQEVQEKGPIKAGRCSSTTYNSQVFNFHISPVNFSYSGTYKCITETTVYTTVILRTIRVSVAPPGDDLRNQSVVLTCEVSEVTDPVTLVWLRMEGNRGVLEKQQILNKTNKMLQLTVNLPSDKTESLHWQCAVFTDNKLRALGPVEPVKSTTNCTLTVTHTVINNHTKTTVSSVLALFTGILIGALLYFCYRKRKSVHSDSLESEPVYINISQMRNDREQMNINKRDETPETDSVTYATVYFNKLK